MNGRRFDDSHDLVPLPQLHVLVGLIGNQGFERKATVEVDAHHRPFAIHGPNVPEQVIASAALRQVGNPLLQHHVLGVDADIHFPIERAVEAGRRESDNLLWADLNGCQAVGHLHDYAALDGIDSYDARHGEVDRRGEYLLHRAALAHSSCFEDDHMIAERERLDAIVGHQYRRHSQLNEPMPELPPQMVSGGSIERGKRLVEQEQTRPADQRARKRNALLLPSGQLPRVAILETGQPEQRRDLLDALPPLRRRDLAQAVADVLGYTQMGEEGVILEQVADPATLRREKNTTRGVAPDFVAETDGAALRFLQPRQASQRRRLSRARRTEEDGQRKGVGGVAQLYLDHGSAGKVHFEPRG